MSDVERFVLEANIKRFLQLLACATDEDQKRLLGRLLSEESARWRRAVGWNGAAKVNAIAAARPDTPDGSSA